jgi:hypothetical protein
VENDCRAFDSFGEAGNIEERVEFSESVEVDRNAARVVGHASFSRFSLESVCHPGTKV